MVGQRVLRLLVAGGGGAGLRYIRVSVVLVAMLRQVVLAVLQLPTVPDTNNILLSWGSRNYNIS